MEDKLKKRERRERRPRNKIGAHCNNLASEGPDLKDWDFCTVFGLVVGRRQVLMSINGTVSR